ncbi:MAG: hypothetical protein EBZ48_03390 [Proteobacteria bacterium]|nr:hypothetical protein [Pseudomonadota bacterium]
MPEPGSPKQLSEWEFIIPDEDPAKKQQWERAYSIASRIGRVDSNFSSSIRSVKYAETRAERPNIYELKVLARNTMLPLLKRSPTLKSVFYFAAESMFEERLEDLDRLTLETLFELFDPGESASVLGLTYLSKKLEGRCDPDEWERISSLMQVHMELGSLVGGYIDTLGPGTGMLLGGVRCLAYGFFAVENLRSFKLYRRQMKDLGRIFDINVENEIFGCNHLQVASIFVQSMGFGLSAGLGLGLGMARRDDQSSQDWFNCLDEETRCWQAALAWTEALHGLQPPPDFIPAESEYSITDESLTVLRKTASTVLAKGSSFHWITKRADDLSKELQIRLGTVFNTPEEEKAIFEELEESGDYAKL